MLMRREIIYNHCTLQIRPQLNDIAPMQSKKNRLDRFISVQTGINRKDVRLLLAKKRIKVNGTLASDINQVVGQFDKIELDDKVLQDNQAIYLMLHKPVGVVSATKDDQHKTVLDLLPPEYKGLHITGRLDLNSSGLILLTNNGEWSSALTSPDKKVAKVYEVTLEKPLTNEYIQAFADGMYFAYEEITTRPAQLEIISEYVARVSLEEGRYHQIKRMFGRFRNQVLKLHRLSIGALILDNSLAPGESRQLTLKELASLSR
jgi:16S rRNA pseudouridine516 synthase